MSEIKYEDIYYMIKDVAYDQEDPIEAYKKIEKELDTSTTLADRYKAEAEFLKTDNHEFIRLLIKRSKEIDRLTAQCKVAEDLLVECKDTILYIKQYVDGHELSAEDDGDNMIKAINDFLGVP